MIKQGDKDALLFAGNFHWITRYADTGVMLQVGLLSPEPVSTGQLCTGQVGYVITGMKSTRSCRVGDTWHLLKQPVEMLPGFKPTKSMVFAGAL